MRSLFYLLILILCTAGSCTTKKNKSSGLLPEEVTSGREILSKPQTKIVPQDATKAQQEQEPEEDCIFNNDLKGLTIEAINTFDTTISYYWDDEQHLAVLPIGSDTLKFAIGGCDHFAYTATYSSNHSFQDSLFWINKAQWIATSFWGVTGEELFHKIGTAPLIKTTNRDILLYEFPEDTSISNLFYPAIRVEKLKNSAQLTIGAYYN